MSKKVVVVRRIGVLALPLLILLAVLWLRPPLVALVSQPAGLGEAAMPLAPEGAVEQTFVATDDHVDAVGLVLATAGIEDGTAAVALKSAGDGSVVQSSTSEASVQLADVSDWQNVIFRVPRFATRLGSTYGVLASSTSSIFLGTATSDAYPPGLVTVAGAPSANDLIFRVYRGMEAKDLARPATGAPVWVAALALLAAAVIVGWAAERLLLLE